MSGATAPWKLDFNESLHREIVRKAFAALRAGKRGPNDAPGSHPRIIARMNFSCCGSCGHHELHEMVVERREAGKTVLGYCFYHAQSEPLESGAYLMWGLGFESQALCTQMGLLDLTVGEGLPEDADEDTLELTLGRAIVSTLEAFGLDISWPSESAADGIYIQPPSEDFGEQIESRRLEQRIRGMIA